MSDPIIPTPEQLAERRREHWHQTGSPLLTMESLLPWLQSAGLVLFAPRGSQFPSPTPTLVEAVLGAPTPASSVADREPARSLLGRMVAEGTALPLNLLGASGTTPEEPDFVVSTAVFPYLFTLRGDKGWKQLPTSAGPFKVSPLAVNTYTVLSDSGPRSAADLADELGKGLTEAAVLRALSELWQHLRVLPVSQPDGHTLWELTATRFTKAIKTGANAGQPSALSALITLYLGQALLATEDDVELFLSPLAPRSRIRDVVHALSAARELGSVVVEGKHLLHVTGDLPAFAPAESSVASFDGTPALEGEGRIKKFGTGPRKPAVGKGKPFAAGDRERRPFDRTRGPVRKVAASKPAFNRPWDEERADRIVRADASSEATSEIASGISDQPEFQDIDLDAESAAEFAAASTPADQHGQGSQADQGQQADRPAEPAFTRVPGKKLFSKSSAGDRKSNGDRPTPFGNRKPYGDRKPSGDRPSFGDRPRPSFGDRPRPSFGDRPRPARPSFGDRPRPDRPSFGDRPRPSAGDRKPSGDRPSFGDRDRRGPTKPSFGDRPRPSFSDRPRTGGGDRPAYGRSREGLPASSDRPASRPDPRGEGGPSFKRPSRPTFDRGSGGDRPPFRPAGDRPSRTRPDAAGAPRPPRRDFTGKPFAAGRSDRPSRPRPEGAGRPETGRPPFKRFDAPRSRTEGPETGRPFKRFDARPAKPGGFSARPAPGGKRPFSKPGGKSGPGGKPEGPFDKFKGNNKPWGKRPPKRKIKPEGDQA